MATPDWKIVPETDAKPVEWVSFLNCRKFFAADNSGSTHGVISHRQRAFVNFLNDPPFVNPSDALSLWGSRCSEPTTNFHRVQWTCNEGTFPTVILQKPSVVQTIKASDVWYLLTDGDVYGDEVQRLASLAQDVDVLNVPIVFVIVGTCRASPEQTNISVGISFFAGAVNTMILFKDVQRQKVFVIAAKGCFAELGPSASARDLSNWGDLPVYEDEVAFFERCKTMGIKVPRAESREGLSRGVTLGTEWEEVNGGAVLVDLDGLVKSGLLPDEELFNLLAEEAFGNLAVAYKIRRRMSELRAFIQGQKVEQLVPVLEDRFGAAAIIAKMADSAVTAEERKRLQTELRDAHAKNREHYQRTVAELVNSASAQQLRKRNQLVDAALRTLASVEAAGFNAEILARRSNRARRAEIVSSDTSVPTASLDLEGHACRGYCLVCCGEKEVMSICLKSLPAEFKDDNTTDFALNFPLAAGASEKNVSLLSSQNICFQCALWEPRGMTIYKEPLKAIIPAVNFDGHNKQYIHNQLYLALTDGLATGAAGISQLFMAILDEVLGTKAWAGAGLDQGQMSTEERNETVQRQRTFSWMLDQFVQNTWTRETFSEVGDWVAYPQALQWVAKDFKEKGLASFAVTYPPAGFRKLVSLGKKTGAFDEDLVEKLRVSKAVYSVAAKYQADWQKSIHDQDHSNLWKHNYLSAIYKSFNAPLVPRDLGNDSLVTDITTFTARLNIALDGLQTLPAATQRTVMHKIQVILFWLLHHQRSHCTAQTFFTTTADSQPLAPAVFDPALPVPEPNLRALLLSIFASTNGDPINCPAAALHTGAFVPFANPFGASVLQCGVEACGVKFYDGELDPKNLDEKTVSALRKARAEHLIQVFGMRGRFEGSQTGLPERTATGSAPASAHSNLHISIVRVWRELGVERRRAVLADVDGVGERAAFVAEVVRKVCEGGRGNVLQDGMEGFVKEALPSFFKVLRQAIHIYKAKKVGNVEMFDFDQVETGVADKARFELEVMKRRVEVRASR